MHPVNTKTHEARARTIAVQRNEDEMKRKENCGIKHTVQHSRRRTTGDEEICEKIVSNKIKIGCK